MCPAQKGFFLGGVIVLFNFTQTNVSLSLYLYNLK